MIVSMEMKDIFEPLKRKWNSFWNSLSYDGHDKPSSQSSLGSKSSPTYIYETSESPSKKPKTNGYYWGEQKDGPYSSHPVPKSRAPTHTSSRALMTSNMSNSSINPSNRTQNNQHHRQARIIPVYQPRGRSDAFVEFDPAASSDHDRRLAGLNTTSTAIPRARFPSVLIGNGFAERDTLNNSTVDWVNDNRFADAGRISAFPLSKPSIGFGSTLRQSKPIPAPFSEYLKNVPTTALEKLKSTQQNAPLDLAFRKPYRHKPTNGFSTVRLEDSFSTHLRNKLHRTGTTSVFSDQKNGLTSKANRIPEEPKSLPDVVTIEDSDDEIRVLLQSPLRRTKTIDWDTEKKRRDARAQQTFGRRPTTSPSEDERSAEDFYRDVYRTQPAVSPERQNRILDDLSKRTKLIAVDDVDYIPLNGDATEAIDRAFASGRTDEVLTEAFRVKMTRKDFATLKGLNWLNDEIANFFLEMIMDRSTRRQDFPKVHAFNTFFYTQLMNRGYASLKRWTKKIDLFSFDLILVPVHLSSHWCLAVIDLKKKQMRYYDSLGHKNEQCFRLLRTYLEEEKKDKGSNHPHWSNISLDWEEWDFISVAEEEDIPQQKNMCDCGVFMLKFADFVSRGKNIDFNQEHMPYFRRRICYEILQNKLLGF
ncbi:hypothetical protein RvY_10293 [Ramazzottius varieornatus]|uniref:Ubiquitin-like protease family profile domain-containing protein n=1 Tax=Ramazzottius varieornatus TaxID=947166 RepID=A0A1D1VES2_RAMVA|nr:hypothetical protein RvY_10293 [Ramazzottius varieornatus]